MARDPRFSPTGATGSGERSLSSWLGCGCAGLVALFMVAVVTMTFLTWRAGKELGEMTRDPERAAAAVAEVLPYDELPAGYHAFGTLSIPFVMNVAFLGGPDHPAAEGGDPVFEQGFLYVRVRDWFGRGEQARSWLESGEGDQAPIDQEEIRFDPEEVVGRGELSAGGAEVSWVARRGRIEIDSSRFEADGEEEGRRGVTVRVDREEEGGEGPGEEIGGAAEAGGAGETGAGETGAGAAPGEVQEGVLNLMSIRCGDDGSWERMGIWFVPDPAPRAPVDAVDWGGTPADPDALADFLAHFQLCGE